MILQGDSLIVLQRELDRLAAPVLSRLLPAHLAAVRRILQPATPQHSDPPDLRILLLPLRRSTTPYERHIIRTCLLRWDFSAIPRITRGDSSDGKSEPCTFRVGLACTCSLPPRVQTPLLQPSCCHLLTKSEKLRHSKQYVSDPPQRLSL